MLTRRNDVEYRANDGDDDDDSSSSDSDSESSEEEESDSDSFGDEYEYDNEPEATTSGELRDLSDLSDDATDGEKKNYMHWTTKRLLRFLNDAQQPITAQDFPNFDHERLKATNRLGISKLWSIMQEAGVVKTPPEDEKVVCESPGPEAYIDGKKANGPRYKSPYLTFTASGKDSSRTGRKYHVSGTKKKPTDLEKYRDKCDIAKKFYKSRHDAK